VGWGEVAADHASVCQSFIEVDGLSYHSWYDADGCVEVDTPFLGQFIAISEGVQRHVALALAFPDPREHGAGCVGWHLWNGSELSKQEERILHEAICRVRPPEKPDPQSCIGAASTAE
jgi:hypothetical protein